MQELQAKPRAASRKRVGEPTRPKAGLRRGEVQDQVLAAVRRGLSVGAFVPGQVMSLRKLAAHFGTSPMPVRKALTQLVAANVLEELPNRSVRVPRLSESRVKELTELRIAVEGMATRAACARMTPERLQWLSEINVQLTEAIERRDIVACLATNQAFHFTLYEAAQSEVLMPLIEPLWLQCGPTMFYSLLAPDMPWDASAHGELLAALRAGDAALAQRAIARDIRTTWRNIRARSRRRGEIAPVAPVAALSVDLASPQADALRGGNGQVT